MKNLIYTLIIIGLAISANAQYVDNYVELDNDLNEISGLEIINDKLLVAINDGGNDEEVFLLNFNGEIIKKVKVNDVKNKDWEDIASDGTYIYIGDIGNNSNKRKKLKIYKISIDDLLNKKEVRAKEISFSYMEQKLFPPSDDSLYYDAEGMTYRDDSIWIFTKNRSIDTDGNSWIYKIPTKPGHYDVEHSAEVFIGKDGWLTDGITAVDSHDDMFYFLTYTRYIAKKLVNGKFEDDHEFMFDNLAQRESIVVKDNYTLYVADEKNPLVGDVKLYRVRINLD